MKNGGKENGIAEQNGKDMVPKISYSYGHSFEIHLLPAIVYTPRHYEVKWELNLCWFGWTIGIYGY